MSGPILESGSATPEDLLGNAAFVVRFLAEVSPHLRGDGLDPGLSEAGSQGLYWILSTVESTINEAINRM